MEEDSEFVYLALERCRSTLSDAVQVRSGTLKPLNGHCYCFVFVGGVGMGWGMPLLGDGPWHLFEKLKHKR